MWKKTILCVVAGFLFALTSCYGQSVDSVAGKIANFPSRLFGKIQSKSARLNQQISSQTEKYLQRLAKSEDRLRKKLFKQDSVKAKQLFGSNSLDYTALLQQLHSTTSSVPSQPGITGSTYIPFLDSLKTSIKFLQQNPRLLANSAQWQGQAAGALAQVNQLQNNIQVTDRIQQLIRQRRDQIRQALTQYSHLPAGIQSSYQGYSQQAYYYDAQLKQYKTQLTDPDQLTQKAMGILNQRPDFQSFMKSHSDLSGMFSLPGSIGSTSAKALAGLQTRTGIQQQLQGQVTAGGSNAASAVQQKIQSAKAQLQQWKDKVLQAGGGSSAMDVPDFRPNTQRTKTLWGRLVWGLNLQSLPSTYALPATSDLGVSIGYKLSDRNTVGLGGSFKMGWGTDIQHISISSQGLSLRSFWETKLKGSFYAYGGFEYDYQQIIYSITQINNLNYWTKSGLIGVAKQYKISSKVKGELQLLWDFLSYQQVPKTSPILFRVGYAF